MTWKEQVFIGLDFETTSPDPKIALPVEIGLIIVSKEGAILEDFSAIVNPGITIPEEAIAVHGITQERVEKEGIPCEKALETLRGVLLEFKTAPVVIYNVPYDWSIVYNQTVNRGISMLELINRPICFIDPLVIDRSVDKYRKGSRKLNDVCKHYGVSLENAHSAKDDAHATCLLTKAIIKEYPAIGMVSLVELQNKQIKWYNEWKRGINNFWFKTGNPSRVTGSWPV